MIMGMHAAAMLSAGGCDGIEGTGWREGLSAVAPEQPVHADSYKVEPAYDDVLENLDF